MADLLTMLGLVLEVGGIVMALRGIATQNDALFPNRRRPYRTALRAVKRLLVRLKHALGLQPPPGPPRHHSVHVSGTAHVTGDATARVVGRGSPSKEAPLEEWIAYWERRMNDFKQDLELMTTTMQVADADNSARIDEESRSRKAADAKLEERLPVMIGGEEGRELVRTSKALVATAVGAALQGVASLLG